MEIIFEPLANLPIKSKRLGNYPYFSLIFSISMALFVIGLFGVLIIFANKLSEIIKENIEVQAYLDYNLDEDAKRDVLKRFYGEAYIATKNGKKAIYYISKEQAAKKFIKETGEDFVKFLGDNPLRDAYIIKINSEYSNQAMLKRIKIDLESIDGIYEVVYIESLIDAINKNIAKISLILLSFAGILTGVVFVLINNSIKLALYSQRFIIRSMQLVGATSFFIKRPFVLRAMLYGGVGGVVAILMLVILLQYAYTQIPELHTLESYHHFLFLGAFLILFGALLGFYCSITAMNKYLNMSLNDLY
ncbi:MAG: ABC transporter permease [Cytophagales bacterium]|nr:ABC transporter permease [Cytophagales bacterium]